MYAIHLLFTELYHDLKTSSVMILHKIYSSSTNHQNVMKFTLLINVNIIISMRKVIIKLKPKYIILEEATEL